MGEGHVRLVEYVSVNEIFSSRSTNYTILFHRQIFGSVPKNINEEDILHPTVSTLDLLKAQRARKAAAKKALEESETESETQPEFRIDPENPPPVPPSEIPPSTPASEIPLSASEDSLAASKHLSWDFADERTVPPGLRRKDVQRRNPYADTAQHNCDKRGSLWWLDNREIVLTHEDESNRRFERYEFTESTS